MDKVNKTLARQKGKTLRYETHTYPDSRRRFAVTRDSNGRIVAMVHIATVSDNRPLERW